jgi:hypothetical protein
MEIMEKVSGRLRPTSDECYFVLVKMSSGNAEGFHAAGYGHIPHSGINAATPCSPAYISDVHM